MAPASNSTPSSHNTRHRKDSTKTSEDTLRSVCVCCQEEIPTLGVQCAFPSCPNIRFCAQCFADGAEIGPHKTVHPYRIFYSGRCFQARREPSLDSSINSRRTTATAPTTDPPVWYDEEQIRLLKALEKYGYGNWQEVANFITTKTAQEAKEEYIRRYVNGRLGQFTWAENHENPSGELIDETVSLHIPGTSDNVRVGPLSPSLLTRQIPLGTREEMRVLGGMHKRDDFEIEYDNNAEAIVSNLSFDINDSEVEVGLKLAMVDMYVGRLRERARRKKIVKEHQLVPKFMKSYKKEQQQKQLQSGECSVSAAGPSTSTGNTLPGCSSSGSGGSSSYVLPPQNFHELPPEDVPPKVYLAAYRDRITEKLLPFAQFYTKKDFDTLVDNMVVEQELKLKVRQLTQYRRLGLETREEITAYEKLKQVGRDEANAGGNSRGGQIIKRPLDAVSEAPGEADDSEDDDYEEPVIGKRDYKTLCQSHKESISLKRAEKSVEAVKLLESEDEDEEEEENDEEGLGMEDEEGADAGVEKDEDWIVEEEKEEDEDKEEEEEEWVADEDNEEEEDEEPEVNEECNEEEDEQDILEKLELDLEEDDNDSDFDLSSMSSSLASESSPDSSFSSSEIKCNRSSRRLRAPSCSSPSRASSQGSKSRRRKSRGKCFSRRKTHTPSALKNKEKYEKAMTKSRSQTPSPPPPKRRRESRRRKETVDITSTKVMSGTRDRSRRRPRQPRLQVPSKSYGYHQA